MSIISYFKDKAELKSATALAQSTAEKIKASIERGSLEEVTHILDWATPRTMELLPAVAADFLKASFNKGQPDILDVLLNKLYGSNPNQIFQTDVSESIGNDQRAWRSTYKTYLYSAMEMKRPELALYLAQHKNLDPDHLSSQEFRGATTWKCSAIAQARETGMLQVVIALAERLAERRRDQGKDYQDKMIAEAEGFEHEAEQLRRLDLPNGVYKLPALNQPS